MDIALVFLPAMDIALYVGEGRVDMGITGRDVVAESGVRVEHLLDFHFGKCRLCLLAPKEQPITPNELAGQPVATSFPNITRSYFAGIAPDRQPKIRNLSGSVESSCALGLAAGVVDLVESGETIAAAGLEIIDTIMQTNAVLIGNANSKHSDLMGRVCSRLEGVVQADFHALIEYNIPQKQLETAKQLTPGKTAPTVSHIEKEGWVAVKAMILRSETNLLLEQLHAVGATDIIIYRIDNCRS